MWIDQIEENDFTLKKIKCIQYSIETKTDTDYTDDLILFTNAPVQDES